MEVKDGQIEMQIDAAGNNWGEGCAVVLMTVEQLNVLIYELCIAAGKKRAGS